MAKTPSCGKQWHIAPSAFMRKEDVERMHTERRAGMLFVVSASDKRNEVVRFTGSWDQRQIDNDFIHQITMQVEDVTGCKRTLPATDLRQPNVLLLATLSFHAQAIYAKRLAR